jgi:hypothetical protein
MARRVSYFQRFSQPENHATNNTLLALRYFYQSSPFKIERLFSEILETELSIGLIFEQQVKNEAGVPDAEISQQPLRIVIETKRGGTVDVDQLERHMNSMSQNTAPNGKNFLFALTKEPIPESLAEQLKKTAQAKGITFSALTFSRLLQGLEAQCADYERDFRDVLDDFKDYLSEEDLLDERHKWLAIFPCGTSFEENVRLGVYYESPSRSSKAGYPFIGIYRQKTVSHVGRVQAVVIVTYKDGSYSYEEEVGVLTEDQKKRIISTFEETTYYDLKSEVWRFYVVGEFIKTDARKISPNGIFGFRYLDLSKLIPSYDGKEPLSAEKLATLLNGSTWT